MILDFFISQEAFIMKVLLIMVVIGLLAAMSMTVAGIGPAPAQACGTDKGPPPPG
jgi:hypothetical protein